GPPRYLPALPAAGGDAASSAPGARFGALQPLHRPLGRLLPAIAGGSASTAVALAPSLAARAGRCRCDHRGEPGRPFGAASAGLARRCAARTCHAIGGKSGSAGDQRLERSFSSPLGAPNRGV